MANKTDRDIPVTLKCSSFARKFSLPLDFVSAADGTNVLKLFNDATQLAIVLQTEFPELQGQGFTGTLDPDFPKPPLQNV